MREKETWNNAKTEYLRQVEKALSSVKHPRKEQVLEDVRTHMEQRAADFEQSRLAHEDIHSIIAEMGPASDYAELLDPESSARKQNIRWIHILSITVAAVIIAAAILLPMVLSGEKQPVTLAEFRRDFPQKVAKLNIDTAKLDDVITIFGEPIAYVWGQRTIEKNEIPTAQYCVN